MAKRRVDERKLNKAMGWPESWDARDPNDLRPDEEEAIQKMLAEPFHLQRICERVSSILEDDFQHCPPGTGVTLTRGPDGFVAAAHVLIRATKSQ